MRKRKGDIESEHTKVSRTRKRTQKKTKNSSPLFSSPLTSERLRRLVDPQALWQLPVALQRASLLGAVLQDHVGLPVLVVPQPDENDVAGIDPDLF